jgi:L-ascorbate metabolism protein UlaG (beta-lactamase superfamily)
MGLAVVTVIAMQLVASCGGESAKDEAAPSGSPELPTAPASPSSQGVTLGYGGNAQVELSTAGGPRVFIDVWNTTALPAPPAAGDILLTTHVHDDHVDADFAKGFPGRQLFVREGEIESGDVRVLGVAAAHSQGDPLKPEGGSAYIFVIDIGGLRIAHFGDIGQDQLTAEQLDALGDVDVAITQLENSFSQMDMKNKKGFDIVAQVDPRLVVQTHSSMAAVQYAKALWPVLYAERPAVTLTSDRLPRATSLLLLGEDAAYYAQTVPVEKVDW